MGKVEGCKCQFRISVTINWVVVHLFSIELSSINRHLFESLERFYNYFLKTNLPAVDRIEVLIFEKEI
ncbi:unnamed protein product [Lactuca virosa]|uniref:Uncharacterized protein n=1 Tax=Lactuca virosa TaxID=75947 RepID=A0AAU9NC94_9ASTR|nr:unnamed protein product [Lactuca virosa]